MTTRSILSPLKMIEISLIVTISFTPVIRINSLIGIVHNMG